MIYDVNTRELKTNDGKLLKKLNCPLHKQWSQLKVIPEDTGKRHCDSCKKVVFDLAGKSEGEVKLLLQESPDSCVYLSPKDRNIRFAAYKDEQFGPCPFRRIHTARGEDAINQAADNGFWPLVKPLKRDPKMLTSTEVYQNEKTGEILTRFDWRHPPSAPWKRVVRRFMHYPYYFEHDVAAYLLPSDLQVGERVFLVDLIEDLVAMRYGNHASRVESAYAVWNGKDFKIEWNERTDAADVIG